MIHTMLTEIDYIPEGFLDVTPENLHSLFSGPTLIHLDGKRQEPLFVSVLLHGNETTGILAIQDILKRYNDKPLPRALSIFVGNVHAAREGQRHLKHQPDYNRIWPCHIYESELSNGTPEHAMMEDILNIMRDKNVFASIDIHNNTGLNPHYACINKLDTRFFHLATLFSRTVVYFIRPRGVQSMAFAEICPSVTVECGKADHAYGTAHAAEFIATCLQLSEIPVHPVAPHDMDLFHTVATVKVPEHIDISFDGKHNSNSKANTICFLPNLDHLNFTELAPGVTLGYITGHINSPINTGAVEYENKQAGTGETELPVQVKDERGEIATRRYFNLEQGELRIMRQVMPSMFTLDIDIIRQDCLGYLMERMDWQSILKERTP